MKTLILDGKNEKDLARAAHIVMGGGLCAMPTETVYGLAADALDKEAVKSIFDAKGRPQDNPLIVHICSVKQLSLLWESVPEKALTLSKAFWPGPLTMVYKKNAAVPDEVTAGLDTVAVRMPSHKVALELIRLSGKPLAAPSANLSGKPSPTCVSHVIEDMDGRIDCVLDGGESTVGVESTVVDMTGETPRILRPGAISEEMIAEVLGAAETDPAVTRGVKNDETPRSPGMKYRHYAPSCPVTLFCGAPDDTVKALLGADKNASALVFEEYLKEAKAHFKKAISFGYSWDHAEHTKRVFAALRELDGKGDIFVQAPRELGCEAAVTNRLKRAAGFSEVKCTEYTVIGVTGRSGSGKGYVSLELSKKLSLAYFDADAVYKNLLLKNDVMKKAVLDAFPDCAADGEIDRKALGAIVYNDLEKKRLLESLTHPFVKSEAEKFIKENTGAVIDAPLLFESTIDRLCTLTVGVYCEDGTSLSRILARDGITGELASLRLSAQPPVSFYRERCDIMIKNEKEPELSALIKKLI